MKREALRMPEAYQEDAAELRDRILRVRRERLTSAT